MLVSSADRHTASSIPVIEIPSECISTLNHQIYGHLQLALSLNLRRQIFVAVCDDPQLRRQFASQLEAECNADVDTTDSFAPRSARAQPPLISIAIDFNNPDVFQSIRSELESATVDQILSFQIVEVDQLTRQPVHIQRSFLESLSIVADSISKLEFNLLLWVNRPWCRVIQQSAPEFWRWHTAVFEFEGDPIAEQASCTISHSIEADHPRSTPQPRQQASIAYPRQAPSREAPPPHDAQLTEWVLASVTQSVDLPDSIAVVDATNPAQSGFEPIQILQQINRDAQRDPIKLATAYRQLGDWYRDRLDPIQPSAQALAIAIRAYEHALKSIEVRSDEALDLLNDIGNLYWMKARTPRENSLVNLEKALRAFQFARDRCDPNRQPNAYAMIQNNLGSVYSDLAAQQDPIENLQRAIEAYQASIDYRSHEADRSRYAATQNNLGTAYWHLAQHHAPMVNFQNAIAAYNEALNYYDPEQEPMYYAMLQNNLGTAYWNLSQCEQAVAQLGMAQDFLRLAIGAYRVALTYRTVDAAPLAYAATQNNLGTAYWHLSQQAATHYHERPTYLMCAIDAYEEAISTANFLATLQETPPLSFDLAATQHHIGLAYYQLALDDHAELEAKERSDFLNLALQSQIQAAQGWQTKLDVQPNAIHALAQTVRSLHDRGGIEAQTKALSAIPPRYLSSIMPQL